MAVGPNTMQSVEMLHSERVRGVLNAAAHRIVHDDWEPEFTLAELTIAACSESNVDFFPEERSQAATKEQRRVCRGCPIVEKCAGIALYHDLRFGIWAESTPNQRTRVRNQWKIQEVLGKRVKERAELEEQANG